jgi:hypothetical protein
MYTLKLEYFPNDEYRLCVHPDPSPRPLPANLDIGPKLETATKTLDSSHRDRKETVTGDTKRPGFGLPPRRTQFGLAAKRKLQRVGGALDKTVAHPNELIFLTGTLPGSTDRAYQAISDYSGYVVHRLKAWLAKRVKSKYDFYVWELQKRGALHLHYCIHIEDNSIAKFVLTHFHDEWNRILESVCEMSGVDVYEKSRGGSWRQCKTVVQAYAQRVKKSVAAYLSKYCSKNASKPGQQMYYPSRWWGVSRPLNKLLGDMTETLILPSLRNVTVGGIVKEVVNVLEVVASKLFNYADKFGRAYVWVAYSKHNVYRKLKCTMIQNSGTEDRSKDLLIPGSSLGESITTRLRFSIQYLRLTPWKLSQTYSKSAGESLLTFLTEPSCNLWQSLELVQAIEYLLGNLSNTNKESESTRSQLKYLSLASSALRSRIRQSNGLDGSMPLKLLA